MFAGSTGIKPMPIQIGSSRVCRRSADHALRSAPDSDAQGLSRSESTDTMGTDGTALCRKHLPDLGQRPFCGQKLRQKPPGQAFTIYFDGPWLTLVHAGTSTDTSIFRWWPPRLLSPYLSRNACTTEATPFARHVG